MIILVVPRTQIDPTKTQIPNKIFKADLKSSSEIPVVEKLPQAISNTGIIKGNAKTAIIGALFCAMLKDPQKAQIKFIVRLARVVRIKKSVIKF